MKIRYFAWVREKVGLDEENVDLPDTIQTVADLIDYLKTIDDNHAAAFEEEEAIRIAVDQMHVEADHLLGAADEIAFFPPMTGG